MFRSVLATALTVALLSVTPSFAEEAVAPVTAAAKLINSDGEETGQATLTQGPTGVLIHLKVSGLTPGKHGLHLHAHGVCDPLEGFKTAKGHVGLKPGGHGLLNPEGPEPGDLPNIFVGTDGVGEMEAFTSLVSLVEGPNHLLDEDGSTFIIHENADDHVTQPIGGAGARVACGVLQAD